MKKFSLILLCVIFILMLIFTISGCNTDKQDKNVSTEVTENISKTSPTENPTVSTETFTVAVPPTDTTDYYIKDPDELEIMTIPNQQGDAFVTNGVTVLPTETTDSIPEPTFLPEGEKIELPFVPA